MVHLRPRRRRRAIDANLAPGNPAQLVFLIEGGSFVDTGIFVDASSQAFQLLQGVTLFLTSNRAYATDKILDDPYQHGLWMFNL